MSRDVLSDEILREIEFELVQGALVGDELGEGVQNVKEYQNKLRRELFRGEDKLELRDAVNRLFQLNEMLLTVMQEMARTIMALRLELRGTQSLPMRPSSGTNVAAIQAQVQVSPTNAASPASARIDALPLPPLPLSVPEPAGNLGELERLMSEKALLVPMDARPVSVPLIGPLLQRVRVALHSAILFYVNRVARNQVSVNQSYGDWLLSLNSQLAYQHAEIQRLQEQLSTLQGDSEGQKKDSE